MVSRLVTKADIEGRSGEIEGLPNNKTLRVNYKGQPGDDPKALVV
jgi:hypothetical protein